MSMKPLADGLLCDGKAFTPHFAAERDTLLQASERSALSGFIC